MVKQLFNDLKQEIVDCAPTIEASAKSGAKWAKAVLNDQLTDDEARRLLDLSYEKFHIIKYSKESE